LLVHNSEQWEQSSPSTQSNDPQGEDILDIVLKTLDDPVPILLSPCLHEAEEDVDELMMLFGFGYSIWNVGRDGQREVL